MTLGRLNNKELFTEQNIQLKIYSFRYLYSSEYVQVCVKVTI